MHAREIVEICRLLLSILFVLMVLCYDLVNSYCKMHKIITFQKVKKKKKTGSKKEERRINETSRRKGIQIVSGRVLFDQADTNLRLGKIGKSIKGSWNKAE